MVDGIWGDFMGQGAPPISQAKHVVVYWVHRGIQVTDMYSIYIHNQSQSFIVYNTNSDVLCVCVSQQHQALKQKVDDEVKRIVDEQYQRGMKLLRVTWHIGWLIWMLDWKDKCWST